MDIFGLFIVYRGMRTNTAGRPIVYSGETINGNNAGYSLGIRPGEVAMSTNIDPYKLPDYKRPETFDGKMKNGDMFSIDTSVLSEYGLQAVPDGKNGDGHVSIMTADGVSPEELSERLSQTEKEWISCSS